MIDLVGMEKLTNAFGSISVYQGLGTIIGPPIVGAMKDYFGSYYQPFILTGVIILASGLICFVINPLKKFLIKLKKPITS